MKRYITLDENNMVVSERYGQTITDGEIENENGELGQVMQPDGSFVTPVLEPIKIRPTLDEIAEETLLETKYQTLLLELSQ